MNEKIKQLAEQAGLETQPAKLKIYKNDDGTVTSGGWEYPLEKFAEAIVRECVNLVKNSSLPDSYSEACLRNIADELEEHFGVNND